MADEQNPPPSPISDPVDPVVERALGTGAKGDVDNPEAKPTEEVKAELEGRAGDGADYGQADPGAQAVPPASPEPVMPEPATTGRRRAAEPEATDV